MNIRIGNGYDVHRLAEGLPLWLGGVLIPHNLGSVAHSDGDVLIHAICDALLGAAGLRDIGVYFPDTDPTFKGVDSKILLHEVMKLLREKGYTVGNIDTVICLQRPKIMGFIPQMQETLANVMEIAIENISIKATTSEKLGFVGREEGISAYAVVLLSH
ncbi:2-C-methyl-D-erythritol 2,4-cyclodiphosphate synthase [Williamwhitmania taraxaci]|uniref:2-C-methyl-D-erythritol 2,4-cyclodiphosphate synthase n=1 Tax=Williamwhitmania taraxaci TaxID=1640674 RepID=A0A1G6GSC3_9BACT|nr:2-C-methyl-D-erythritol 2,4-cyclodiphosphate synthase [Williamwhitmania taraxaci]SDB84605.1 2-C-methyl-D-erythritol 2,4-cyclodiphosphate synthase [Williamwhitmania taraxaci]